MADDGFIGPGHKDPDAAAPSGRVFIFGVDIPMPTGYSIPSENDPLRVVLKDGVATIRGTSAIAKDSTGNLNLLYIDPLPEAIRPKSDVYHPAFWHDASAGGRAMGILNTYNYEDEGSLVGALDFSPGVNGPFANGDILYIGPISWEVIE